MPDPGARETFERCQLGNRELEAHPEMVALHRDLLKLRSEDSAFHSQQPRGMDGAVIGPQALVFRYFKQSNEDRLLIVNLGPDFQLHEAPEPLLAPPAGKKWNMLWSSEAWEYGGSGHLTGEDDNDTWRIAGESAAVLIPITL
jgi:maltooligosyltrehalose trehalohydrolase